MKKLIAAAAMVLSTAAVAQPDKDWWACQLLPHRYLKLNPSTLFCMLAPLIRWHC
jgi:hypothetical protein